MNFFSVFCFLDDLLRLHFFTRYLYFYHKWWWEKGKNQFFRYFWRILLKVKEKVLEIHKHWWLLITWILNKLNSIKTLKAFQKSDHLTANFFTKFTFDNSNSPCQHVLDIFYLILIIALSLFRFWVIKNCSGSHFFISYT